MKKKILFDVLALLAIVAGFLVLFYFQDLDTDLFSKLKNTDKNILVDKTIIENSEYVHSKEEKEELENISCDITEPEFQNCYCYSVLSEEEQDIYEEIYLILKEMSKDVTLSTLDDVMIEKVFNCVLNDHPQFYYVDGYTYTTYTTDDIVTRLDFSGNYTKTQEECTTINEQIETYVAACFYDMGTALSDYDKVKYIYDYIVLNTEYNLDATDNQNICSVFLNGESVCMGYARAMQYLLLKQDILCTIVNGKAKGNEEHAWNMVLLDGQYYHMDVTWGDDSYTVTGGKTDQNETVNYSYFCVTTEEIAKNHTINSVVELPECIARENNYYHKEGYYFTSLDCEKIATVFEQGYTEDKDFVELKCENQPVYDEIFQYLIEEQHIFEYLSNGQDNISYYDNEELYLLEFWLK